MLSSQCPNCSNSITNTQHFCSNCGQQTPVHKISLHQIAHDFVHALFHADKGFFFLIKELAVNPGRVAKNYMAGKRKQYYNPLSFLVVITGVFVLVTSSFKTFGDEKPEVKQYPAGMTSEANKAKYRILMERKATMIHFFNTKTNIVAFISTPFIALLLWLFFKRRNRNFAEHLAAQCFFNGFLSLVFSLIISPLIFVTKDYGTYFYLIFFNMLFRVVYVGIAYHGFLELTTKGAYAKTILASMLSTLAWVIVSIFAGTVYMYLG